MKFSLRNHVLFWLAYIIWDTLQTAGANIISSENWPMYSASLFRGVEATLFLVICKIILFYMIYYVVFKLVLPGKINLVHSILLGMGLVCCFLFLQRTIAYYWVYPLIYQSNMAKIHFFNIAGLVFVLMDLLVPVFLLSTFELIRFSKYAQQRENVLIKEKLTTELNYLKAQVNPHFLFNVLSTVHALSIHQAPEAAEVTLRLSKIMRFMLYETNKKYIALAEEIKILEDYIALEQVRFGTKLTIHFDQEVDDATQSIAPLILLPFVENAFKHGTSENMFNSFVHIHLSVQNKVLNFEIENSIEDHTQHESSEHIGLTNVKRQLELVYPQHVLSLEKRERSFYVNLKTTLLQDENL